tara:strand:+ start:2941 stop:3285 length:345 start_codon:yes stop_codon:yes gene_type:complete
MEQIQTKTTKGNSMPKETEITNTDAEGNNLNWVRKVEGDKFTYLALGESEKIDDYKNRTHIQVMRKTETGIQINLEQNVTVTQEDAEHTYTTVSRVVLSKEEAKSMIKTLTHFL